MSKKKILIFIDHDVIIRHFIANDTFYELEKKNEVIYVFNEDKKKFDLSSNEILNKKIKKYKRKFIHIPRKRSGHWYLLNVINLFRRQKIAIGKNGSRRHYNAIIQQEKNLVGSRNVFLAKIASLPIIFQIVRFLFIFKLGINKEIINLIKIEKPDLLIHPSFLHGYLINDLFRASIRYRVPFFVLANSWDNCCNNAFCSGIPDKLVVWGQQAKNHASKYIGVPEKDIVSFGAAQFEIYKKLPKESRKELASFFEAEPNKKILLYAGVGASDSETIYLKLLEKAIEEQELPNCHVIYRPHPWRGILQKGEKDFLSIKWDHISIDPTMKNYYRKVIINPKRMNMHLADYKISNKLLTLVDGVISPLSTMLIESLVKGKPVLAFFPENGKNQERLETLHFEEFININEVNVSFNKNDFIYECKKLLMQINDKSLSIKLKKSVNFFVSSRNQTYGKQLSNLVDETLSSK